MTRLSESSQNKTAHRDSLMVGSFLVREERVRPAAEAARSVLCGVAVQGGGGSSRIQRRRS